jgi:hypothetical protein
MKTQAWGWLAAGVVALGLNGFYQDGGWQWAHQIVDRVSRDSSAVIALATGRADRFLAEASVVSAQREATACPWSIEKLRIQTKMPEFGKGFDRFQVMSARQQEQFARMEAARARMEAKMARLRIPAVTVNSVELPSLQSLPLAGCTRMRVSVPRLPKIRVPAPPVIHIGPLGPDSV